MQNIDSTYGTSQWISHVLSGKIGSCMWRQFVTWKHNLMSLVANGDRCTGCIAGDLFFWHNSPGVKRFSFRGFHSSFVNIKSLCNRGERVPALCSRQLLLCLTISHFVELNIFSDIFCELCRVPSFSTDRCHQAFSKTKHFVVIWSDRTLYFVH